MQITLRNIQYHPNSQAVALFLEPPAGPFKPFFLNTTQAALTARTADGAGVWSDAEALAEAQAQLDAQFPDYGFVAVLPETPA